MRSLLGRAVVGLALAASAAMALGYAFILGGIAAPPDHPAPASCGEAPDARAAAADAVAVYFTCNAVDGGPAARGVRRPTQAATAEGRLGDALNGLLAGPSEAERAVGWTSYFSERTRGMLSRAWIERGGRAIIDLADLSAIVANASTSAGASRLLAELNATAFQFPEVATVEYRFDGSCAAFWRWLGGTCHAERRPG